MFVNHQFRMVVFFFFFPSFFTNCGQENFWRGTAFSETDDIVGQKNRKWVQKNKPCNLLLVMNRIFLCYAISAPAAVISGFLNFIICCHKWHTSRRRYREARELRSKHLGRMFGWRMDERDRCFSTIFRKSVVAMATFLCCDCKKKKKNVQLNEFPCVNSCIIETQNLKQETNL